MKTVERQIYTILLKLDVHARGLWASFRDQVLTGEPEIAGALMQGRRIWTIAQLARVARCSNDDGAQLMEELKSFGLVEETRGLLSSPQLARIAVARRRRFKKMKTVDGSGESQSVSKESTPGGVGQTRD